MYDLNLITGVVIALIVVILVASAIRIVQEYERSVIFRLGRYVGLRGPGIILLIPFIERARKMDLRIITMDVPAQEVITRDNVTVKVDAVIYFRIMDAAAATLKVVDPYKATYLLAQTTLRNVVGQSAMDELLSQRDKLNERIQSILDEGTDPWGIKVSMVEIKQVELPPNMQRMMAAQAEAERDRRAKVVHADGEYQAAERLAEAARVMSAQPAAMHLRFLQTLTTISTEKTNIVVFPLPTDMSALSGLFKQIIGK